MNRAAPFGRATAVVLRVVVSLLVLPLFALIGAPAASASPPANDSFVNAQAVTSLPFTDSGDLNGTSIEPGEPQVCNFLNQSVWYSFTPTTAKAVTIDLSGSDPGVSANVYQSFGPGIGSLGFTGCVGSVGSMELSASANTTYYIQAGSVSTGSAHLQIDVKEVPPPANDDFANATQIGSVPFNDTADRTGAGLESGEPASASCGSISHTIWYELTPQQDETLYAHGNAAGVNSMIAVYTGGSLAGLSEVGCGVDRNVFRASAGTTYWIRVGSFDGQPGALQSFTLEIAPDPSVGGFINPPDPSTYDNVQFSAFAFDPTGFAGVKTERWDFGDGASSDGCCPTHRYSADGTYTATVTATLTDGRTGSNSLQVNVKTHDVGITKMTVPQAASPGQTKPITVSITNHRYPETVQVQLAKSTPGGFANVGTLTLAVPAGKAVDFKFSYVFTDDDAAIGKVSFQATATIVGGRDALPGDNTFTSLATRVK